MPQNKHLSTFYQEIVFFRTLGFVSKSQNPAEMVLYFRHLLFMCLIFFQDKRSEEEEKMYIIETAARILRNDIKRMEVSNEYYPSPDDLESVDLNIAKLPSSLKLLLRNIFSSQGSSIKVASIGQAIVQQVRPKAVTMPLQIGLAIQMHRHFGSRFLVDSLHSHGFCSSYSEVQNFERSAAFFQGTHIPELDNTCDSVFIQYAADNVDHNLRTID